MFFRRPKRKVMVIGLDCAEPTLVFDQWLDDLPNIKQVVQSGVHGKLRSCVPPITVPAWMVMMTGRDPGQLGFYGFRNRVDYSYHRLAIVNSASVVEPTVWDILSEQGKHSIVIGVPPSYPVKPLKGELISCFLTPGPQSEFAHPPELRREVEGLVGEYMVDVKGFRTDDKAWLLQQIYEMTEKRFTVAKHLLRTRPWDFFMMVEMGVDRIHHGFWHCMDPKHVLHPGPNEFSDAIFKYYKYLDTLVGDLLSFADRDTTVLIVSDHGAKRMDGAVALNEWLVQEGYLVLNSYPDQPTRFDKLDVDWSRTKAWGEGGYYGRVFLNVAGREPHGVVDPTRYDAVRAELKERLEALGDEQGDPIGTTVVAPEEVYASVKNIPPDLMVFFGDLYWRSAGMVGGGAIHSRENDTGPDGANHNWDGMFVISNGRDLARSASRSPQTKAMSISDIAPTVLDAFGVRSS